MRSARASRLGTLRVLALSTLPPLTRLSGQSPSHEANAPALGNARSICSRVPTSLVSVLSTPADTPGMSLRSTP